MNMTKQVIVMVSAVRNDKTEKQNTLRMESLKRLILEHKVANTILDCDGCYEGHKEQAFMVFLTTDDYENLPKIARLKQLAKHFDQDSILVIDQNRQATLTYLKNLHQVDLGTFERITELDAQTMDYTKLVLDYYGCR